MTGKSKLFRSVMLFVFLAFTAAVGIVAEEELPYKYSDYFGTPDSKGITIEIEIYELRKNSHRYILLRQFMEQDDFPLFVEYQNVKKYYNDLKDRTNKETDSDNLFDD